MKSQNELDFQVITKFKSPVYQFWPPPFLLQVSIHNQSTVISHCKQHKVPQLITLKNCARCPGTSEWCINHLWVWTDEDQYRNLGVFPFIDLNCTSLTGILILIKKDLLNVTPVTEERSYHQFPYMSGNYIHFHCHFNLLSVGYIAHLNCSSCIILFENI